jgi:hypothetical protein
MNFGKNDEHFVAIEAILQDFITGDKTWEECQEDLVKFSKDALAMHILYTVQTCGDLKANMIYDIWVYEKIIKELKKQSGE